mgnify:CR=1 FL=1
MADILPWIGGAVVLVGAGTAGALMSQPAGPLTSANYVTVRDYVIPGLRAAIDGVFTENKLDAMVYPTSSRRTPLIASDRGVRSLQLGFP